MGDLNPCASCENCRRFAFLLFVQKQALYRGKLKYHTAHSGWKHIFA